MKKIFSSIFILLSFYACQSAKKTVNETSSKVEVARPNVQMSAPTRIFLDDLRAQDDLSNLSGDFKAKYPIKEIDGISYVSGMLQVSSSFKSKSIEELGIKTSPQIGKSLSILVPLEAIDKLLQQQQIEYFEIATKGELK